MTFDFDSGIDRRQTGSNKWSRYPADVLPMWVADMDFAAAPAIVEAMMQRLQHPVFGYCSARPELRAQIVDDLAANYGWSITPEDIVFLPGVEPGFNMAIKALLAPGQSLALQTPIYKPIRVAPEHWSLQPIALRLDRPIAEQRAELARAHALLLCNPHNPTGRVYDRAALLALAEAMGDRPIISDEIHCELLYDGRRHIPIASLDPAIARRSITLMSAAKTYNIPGLKTAFAIIQNPELRQRFEASRLGMVDSVNIMGLEATLAAFRDATDWRDAMLAYLEGNRDALAGAVAEHLPGITMEKPEATYLAWLDCSALGLDDPAAHFLTHARVAFSPGSDFGPAYGQFIRFNFGCTRARVIEAVERMAASL